MNLKPQQVDGQEEGFRDESHEAAELSQAELAIVGGGAGILNYD